MIVLEPIGRDARKQLEEARHDILLVPFFTQLRLRLGASRHWVIVIHTIAVEDAEVRLQLDERRERGITEISISALVAALGWPRRFCRRGWAFHIEAVIQAARQDKIHRHVRFGRGESLEGSWRAAR